MSAESVKVLVCDIDGTLLSGWSNPGAGDTSLLRLSSAIHHEKTANPDKLYFGDATGRVIGDHQKLERDNGIFWRATGLMDFKITGVGSEISFRRNGMFELDTDWPKDPDWDYEALEELLSKRPELHIQDEANLGDHKLSFNVKGMSNERHDEYVAYIKKCIADKDLAAEVLFSMGQYLDLLPTGVNKGTALNYVAGKLVMPSTVEVFKIAAGDTMNDKDMLAQADLAILPGNADETLRAWVQTEGNIQGRLYTSEQPYAAGIHDGLRAYGIL